MVSLPPSSWLQCIRPRSFGRVGHHVAANSDTCRMGTPDATAAKWSQKSSARGQTRMKSSPRSRSTFNTLGGYRTPEVPVAIKFSEGMVLVQSGQDAYGSSLIERAL